MNLETYLASDQARADVRALLDRPMDQADFPQGPGLHLGNRSLILKQEGAWSKVLVGTPDGRAGRADCYYRPQADGFIAADLGDGVRAFRVRTGSFIVPNETLEGTARNLCPSHPVITGQRDCILSMYPCRAEDLPEAICRVLLASYKVANLELPVLP